MIWSKLLGEIVESIGFRNFILALFSPILDGLNLNKSPKLQR
jgi:hypothetical protein